MSLPAWKLRRIRQIVERNSDLRLLVIEVVTHPSTRISTCPIDGQPQAWLETHSSAASELLRRLGHIGRTRPDGWSVIGGNALVPLLLRLAGYED